MELNNVTDPLVLERMPMTKKNAKVLIQKLPLNKIKLSRNSRLNIDPDELSGLMQSIKEEGLLQPIGVVKNGSGAYEIAFGNRRFLACSKLGMSSILAIVHEKQKESDVDIKNLTENVQRRSITLAEIGRYVSLLEEQGLSNREAAVRLGVSDAYVGQALTAFRNVPSEFRNDIEVNVAASTKPKGSRATPGKISVGLASKIINATKSGDINAAQAKRLFKAAKSDSRFQPSKLGQYFKSIQKDPEDFIESAPDTTFVRLAFQIPKKQYEEIEKKFVKDGIYRSVSGFLLDVLRGKKHYPLKVFTHNAKDFS